MNKLYTCVFFVIFIQLGCSKKNDPGVEHVIYNFTIDKKQVNADGTTIVNISIELNPDATVDRRSIQFKTSAGFFVPNKTAYDTVLVQKAQFENKKLIARAILQVPQTPGSIIISVQPYLPDQTNNRYVLIDSVIAIKSPVAAVKLLASSSAVASNYGSEVNLIGTLSDGSGNKVALGSKVQFEDFFANGVPANGIFRATNSISNSNSQVTSSYSVGIAPVGSKISIHCTILDDNGIKTGKSDSIFLIINK